MFRGRQIEYIGQQKTRGGLKKQVATGACLSSRFRRQKLSYPTQTAGVRGKTQLWRRVSHDDFFYVVHPLLSFRPHLLAGLAFPLLSAGVFGAEQTQLHL